MYYAIHAVRGVYNTSNTSENEKNEASDHEAEHPIFFIKIWQLSPPSKPSAASSRASTVFHGCSYYKCSHQTGQGYQKSQNCMEHLPIRIQAGFSELMMQS